jgi:hypothetical protein
MWSTETYYSIGYLVKFWGNFDLIEEQGNYDLIPEMISGLVFQMKISCVETSILSFFGREQMDQNLSLILLRVLSAAALLKDDEIMSPIEFLEMYFVKFKMESQEWGVTANKVYGTFLQDFMNRFCSLIEDFGRRGCIDLEEWCVFKQKVDRNDRDMTLTRLKKVVENILYIRYVEYDIRRKGVIKKCQNILHSVSVDAREALAVARKFFQKGSKNEQKNVLPTEFWVGQAIDVH